MLKDSVVRALEPPPAAEKSTGGMNILVVDDNLDALDSLCELLTLEGHAVRSAASGPAALQLLGEFVPDAVLMDIGLPGMNGYELARAIRNHAGSQGVLLIAVSGYGDLAAKDSSRQAGIDRHLTKPVDLDALCAVLRDGQRSQPGTTRERPP